MIHAVERSHCLPEEALSSTPTSLFPSTTFLQMNFQDHQPLVHWWTGQRFLLTGCVGGSQSSVRGRGLRTKECLGPDGGRKMKGSPCPAAGVGCPISSTEKCYYMLRAQRQCALCAGSEFSPMEYPKMLACGYSARARCGARVGCWANWLISACRSSTCAPVRARVCVALQARYRARRGDATILGRF